MLHLYNAFTTEILLFIKIRPFLEEKPAGVHVGAPAILSRIRQSDRGSTWWSWNVSPCKSRDLYPAVRITLLVATGSQQRSVTVSVELLPDRFLL